MLRYVHFAYLAFLYGLLCSDDAVLVFSNIVYLGNRYTNFIFMQILLLGRY